MNHRDIEQRLLDPSARPREEAPHAVRVGIRRAIAREQEPEAVGPVWPARLAIAAMLALCVSAALLTSRAVAPPATPPVDESGREIRLSPTALVRPLRVPYESEAKAIRDDLERMGERVLAPLRALSDRNVGPSMF